MLLKCFLLAIEVLWAILACRGVRPKMTALAFAGGAAVGAPASMLMVRTFFKDSTPEVMAMLSRMDEFHVGDVYMDVAHDILSATLAVTKNRTKWNAYIDIDATHQESFRKAILKMKAVYLFALPAKTGAAWPVSAGLFGLWAGSVVGGRLALGSLHHKKLLSIPYLAALNLYGLMPGDFTEFIFKFIAMCIALRLILGREEDPSMPIFNFVLQHVHESMVNDVWNVIARHEPSRA